MIDRVGDEFRRADHFHHPLRILRRIGGPIHRRTGAARLRCPAIGSPITKTPARSSASAAAASFRSAIKCGCVWIAWMRWRRSCNFPLPNPFTKSAVSKSLLRRADGFSSAGESTATGPDISESPLPAARGSAACPRARRRSSRSPDRSAERIAAPAPTKREARHHRRAAVMRELRERRPGAGFDAEEIDEHALSGVVFWSIRMPTASPACSARRISRAASVF